MVVLRDLSGCGLFILLVLLSVSCSDGGDASLDPTSVSTTTAATPAATRTLATTTTTEPQVGSFTEGDVVFATVDGAPMTLDVHVPAEPSWASIVITDWESSAEGLVEMGVTAVTLNDEEEEGVVLCSDDPWSNHGACFRALDEVWACAVKFARARAAEEGNDDPTVILNSFSAGSGVTVQVALFGETLEQRWDDFEETDGPPRLVECKHNDEATHVDGVIGMGAPVDMFVPIIDGKYGRAYLQDLDPLLQEFLASPVGTDPNLRIRLIHGTRDEFPMDWLNEFASILEEVGYDVVVIPFDGAHQLPPSELFNATVTEILRQ